jgi:hypothetical protein
MKMPDQDNTRPGSRYQNCEVLGSSLRVVGQNNTPDFMVIVKTQAGNMLSGDIWLTEKAFEKACERIRKVFGDFDTLADLRDGERYAGVLCDVETEFYTSDQGHERERVKWFNRAGSVSGVDDTQFAMLEDRLGGLMARYNASRKPVEPPKRVQVQAAPEAADQVSEDDLPF